MMSAWLRTKLMGATIMGIASGASGCHSAPGRSPSPLITTEGAMVPINVLYQSPNSGIRRALRAVVGTREAFEGLWREVHARTTPTPNLPAVDFAREIVIVASMGFQASVGSEIAITGVRDRSSFLEVTVDVRAFPTGCDTPPEVTYPAVMVRVPATRSTPVFQDRVIETHC
jgi:hypothetical protein